MVLLKINICDGFTQLKISEYLKLMQTILHNTVNGKILFYIHTKNTIFKTNKTERGQDVFVQKHKFNIQYINVYHNFDRSTSSRPINPLNIY